MNAAKIVFSGKRLLLAIAASVASLSAMAGEPERWQLNMTPGVTGTSQNAYDMHMLMLWICVIIGVVVFGAMALAMFKFRKSKGAQPDTNFTHSTFLEVLWTGIPILILVGMAIPATEKVMAQYNAKDHEMTVKVTGYQWMWRYDYVGQDVHFFSRLDRESDRIRQSNETPDAAAIPHYLRDVDNVLVLPEDTKIRFVITSDDVIHAWWVPDLGWKQDAIPGLINEAWTDVSEPGVYRGVCAELCGKDHGFMPIVVKVVSKADYQTWLAATQSGNKQEAARIAAITPATAGGEG